MSIGQQKRTESYALPEDVDINSDEWSQARWEKKVEVGDPSTDDGALLQTLLRELSVTTSPKSAELRNLSKARSSAYVDMDTKDCTPAFSNTAKKTTAQNVKGRCWMASIA